MYFWKYWLRKIWLDKSLKKAVFQRTLTETTRQMGRSTLAIRMTAPLQYLSITVKVVAFEKVSYSDGQNPKAVCQHIDSP